ncbi:Serine/threonine-protein phosphatase PGAM5 [Trichinella spiralis]|uniref:Serine/threonine-protein phosphatase PGAM5 n=1 Tax=Trichinella spiralis TaxID=6334 RepID=A0ABR3K1X5_TRISP
MKAVSEKIAAMQLKVLLQILLATAQLVISAENKCKNTFQIFLDCTEDKIQKNNLHEELETELKTDFAALSKQCFAWNEEFKNKNLCRLNKNTLDTAKLPIMPEKLPDIDFITSNNTQAIRSNYRTRMFIYANIAECAFDNLQHSQATAECFAKQLPRMYNKHCIKLLAGCLQHAMSKTNLQCIYTFDKTKNALCPCAAIQRSLIVENLVATNNLLNDNLPTTTCRSRTTEILKKYLPVVEDAFDKCAGVRLPVRENLLNVCKQNTPEMIRRDSMRSFVVAMSFFQTVIDRFDRFCQAECPHQPLLDYAMSAGLKPL